MTVFAEPTYAVCGIPIATADRASATERILQGALTGEPFQVHLCNAYTLSLVSSDELLRRALLAADLNVPDGAPVAWLGRGDGVRGPVRGADLMLDVIREGVARGARHYLYGGAEGVAEAVERRLGEIAPGAQVVGAECPPWRPLTDEDVAELAERIRASGANVVWIGLGTPRQDHLVHALAPLVAAALVPVGAAYDFISGAVPAAPAALHGTGLEWIYRFAKEPRRLWRRYTVGNVRFVRNVARRR